MPTTPQPYNSVLTGHGTVTASQMVSGAIQSNLIGAGVLHGKRQPRMFFSRHAKAGCRIPAVDRKLMELTSKTRSVASISQMKFIFLEDVIEVFGKYNPLYSGRPKELAMFLLESASGPAHLSKFQMINTGLIYMLPMQTGVRRMRRVTSAAGLGLLDHWAEKFPKFKPFVDAYVSQKMREMITCDCYDMSLGVVPAHIVEDGKKEKERITKWEAREYRRMKKEEERQKIRQQEAQVEYMRQQQMLLSQQYANANKLTTWQPNSSSTATSGTSASPQATNPYKSLFGSMFK